MTNPHNYHSPVNYRIKLKKHLDNKWSEWFEQMAISTEGDQTILTGSVTDQAALHGLFIRIRDMNLTLLSVEQTGPDQQNKNKFWLRIVATQPASSFGSGIVKFSHIYH